MRVKQLHSVKLVTIGAALVAATATAQTQRISPPEAQAWIDLATYTGMGMPSMGAGGANPMAAIGAAIFGRGQDQNRFGNTMTGAAGRWMDVTLMVRGQPSLPAAKMAVPQGSGLAPTLELVAPKAVPAAPPEPDDRTVPLEQERPRGKVSLYWGCGDAVRPGQPRTVDFATAVPADLAQIFSGRRATQRGAHSAAGRPLWPNEQDPRMIPASASLAGAMGFSGTGVPDSFRFNLPAAQDLMPPVALKQTQSGGATRLDWGALATARGYFIAAMGARRSEEGHMVIWTSSEVPDSGFGLIDYQTNPAVDRWLTEKVLLAPGTTTCTVPRGIFEEGSAMLRFVAYGNELNLVHPPRPADVRVAWEQQWALKVRLKSIANSMLGMDLPGSVAQPEAAAPPPAASADPPREEKPAAIRPLEVLRGIFGR